MKHINKSANSVAAHDAVNRAQYSNAAAAAARTAKRERDDIKQTLEDWGRIFTNSPIAILSSLFFLSMLMELFFSWPMYIDLMSQMTGSANFALALIGGLFIVFWGAYISDLLSKKMSVSIFDYVIYNEIKCSKGAEPEVVAEENTNIAAKRDLIKGLILGVILLIIVAGISWQRVWLLGTINGEDYNLTHKLLPIICVLVEIISGVYVGYFFRRIKKSYKIKKLNEEFVKQRNLCVYETKMCQQFYMHAIKNNELIPNSKEIYDALYRYEHRGQDSDNYIDEIPTLKTLKIIVTNKDIFVEGIHLGAVLSNGEYRNSAYTNSLGEAVITWESDAKEATIIYTDNKQHHGRYHENTTVLINLDD